MISHAYNRDTQPSESDANTQSPLVQSDDGEPESPTVTEALPIATIDNVEDKAVLGLWKQFKDFRLLSEQYEEQKWDQLESSPESQRPKL